MASCPSEGREETSSSPPLCGRVWCQRRRLLSEAQSVGVDSVIWWAGTGRAVPLCPSSHYVYLTEATMTEPCSGMTNSVLTHRKAGPRRET